MTTPDTPDQPPLGPDDFDAQDAVLDRLREQAESMPDWEFCEGFLAALVCCRREIPAAEYWPVLLGEDFRPMQEMEFVWRWRRRWAEVAQALDAPAETLADDQAYQPEVIDLLGALLAAPEADRGEADPAGLPAFAEHWAEGFLYAVDSWADEWTPPRDREAAALLHDALDAVARLAGPDTGAVSVNLYAEDGPPSVSEQRLDDFGEAIWSVYDLRQLWKSLGPRHEPLRKAAEPGRNDPCPCGSGRKYKKCHGA
jgi:uncharacterized protein